MAGEHEVVGSEASIPVRILVGDDIDVIHSSVPHEGPVVGFWDVDDLSDHGDAEGEEEQVGLLRVVGPELAHLHVRNEDTLDRVRVLARPEVEHRRLPFFVYVHFQSLFHFAVASTFF